MSDFAWNLKKSHKNTEKKMLSFQIMLKGKQKKNSLVLAKNKQKIIFFFFTVNNKTKTWTFSVCFWFKSTNKLFNLN